MEQCGGGFVAKLDQPEDYHHTFFCDGKIWMFSRKYVAQPTFNWGHRVAFSGGYSICFDPASGEWCDSQSVAPICEDENCEELLFVANNSIYTLLFTSHGEFKARGLYRWCTQGKQWNKEELQVNDDCCLPGDDQQHVNVIVADDAPDANGVFIFVTSGMGSTTVLRLCLSSNTLSKKFDLSPNVMLIPRGRPVKATVANGQLNFCYAVHGCGFRWESERIVAVDPESGEGTEHKATGDLPQFGFAGAHSTALQKNGQWLHIGGSIQEGMCGSRPCGNIYTLNLGENPTWSLVTAKLPDGHSGENTVLDHSTNCLYSAGKEAVVKCSL